LCACARLPAAVTRRALTRRAAAQLPLLLALTQPRAAALPA
jgi:hypothetical protein